MLAIHFTASWRLAPDALEDDARVGVQCAGRPRIAGASFLWV
jgi:hypothetical protein